MQFLGVGTGRCGTMSLARILNAIPQSDVTHERFHPLWYAGPTQPQFVEALKAFMRYNERPDHLIGDVSSFWLPHVVHLRQAIPALRVICLHRPKHQVVESFLKWCGGLSNLRPVDMFIRAEHPVHRQYINLFPTIDHVTAREAWEVYWELCEDIMSKIEPPVRHFQMEELNSDVRLDEIHQFLELDPERRVRPERRVYNQNPHDRGRGISR